MAVRMIEWKGAPAREETGRCLVLDIKHDPGKLNAQVTFKATHVATMVEPVTAWVATNEETFQRVLWGMENRAELWYRIVTHRRKDVDLAIPFEDLEKRAKVRDLVEVRKAADDPMEQQGNALPPGTRGAVPARQIDAPAPLALPAGVPDADGIIDAEIVGEEQPTPAAAAAPPATPVEGTVFTQQNVLNMRALRTALAAPDRDEQLIASLETALLDAGVPLEEIARATNRNLQDVVVGGGKAERSQGSTMAAEALRRAADPDRVGDMAPPMPDLTSEPLTPEDIDAGAVRTGRPVSPVSGLSRRQGAAPIASDAKPWERVNSDGTVNLSSYAAGATMEFVNLAGRLIVTRMRARHSEDPNYVLTAPSAEAVTALARTLLHCADLAQTSLFEGSRVDRMASSYKLARQAVREALDLYPVPWDTTAEEKAQWKADVVAHASLLMNVGFELLR